MKENGKTTEAQGVEVKRAKTISLTASQIGEISNSPKLGQLIINQMNDSDGNLKGNMAFGIAKAMAKQMKIDL